MFQSDSNGTLDTIGSQYSHAVSSGGTIDDALEDAFHVPQTAIGFGSSHRSCHSPLVDSRSESPIVPSSDTISVDEPADVHKEADEEYTDRILSEHDHHLFVLTMAGKPVYSRHGEATRLGEVFGILQLLFHMRNHSNSGDGDDRPDSLCQIEYADLSLYFYLKDDMLYVKALRQEEESPHDTNYYSVIKQELQHIHCFLYSIIPNLREVLANNPSYDVRGYLINADFKMLTEWINKIESNVCFALHAVPLTPLQPKQRGWLSKLVADLRAECKATCPNYLYTFLFFYGKVVSVFSPVKGFCTPCVEDYTNCGLGTTDLMLLLNFIQCGMQRQQCGQLWAPICLPYFNDTGYVWCHVSNFSSLVRESLTDELSGSAVITETPSILQAERGLLLVHITAGDADFAAIQSAVEQSARSVANVPESRRQFHVVEQELIANCIDRSTFSDNAWLKCLFESCRPPFLWFGVSHGGEFIEKTRKNVVSGYFESAEHPFFYVEDAVLQDSLYQQLLAHINSLHKMPHAPSSLPLLVVGEPQFSAVLLRPTAALVTLLCQQFYTSKDMGPPKRSNETGKSSSGENIIKKNGICSHPPKRPFDFKKFQERCISSISEVICVFPSYSSEELMLSWVTFLLIRLTAQLESLVLEEMRS
ncbi:Trafficking protein Mon1, putative [Angomonas deanei]|uniref:Trafficking protein Mon1, putative n=1 Tax=Angomonas deanei TaxID=59799 RepID=A0A7G2CD59_9TRYP|nr:Trafficking protein Mon1, putative [Angomonas deanei]